MLYRKYIDVIVVIDREGNVRPLEIIWEDENGKERFKIDKVIKSHKTKSNRGQDVIVYECIIEGKRKELYYDNKRWFVERVYNG